MKPEIRHCYAAEQFPYTFHIIDNYAVIPD